MAARSNGRAMAGNKRKRLREKDLKGFKNATVDPNGSPFELVGIGTGGPSDGGALSVVITSSGGEESWHRRMTY